MSIRFGQIFGNKDIQTANKHIKKMPSIISRQENANYNCSTTSLVTL